MKIPDELRIKLEEITQYKEKELKQSYAGISDRYMNNKRDNNTLLSSEIDVLSYIIARMPATYSAIYSAITTNYKHLESLNIKTLLDVGAGTGSITWALSNLINFETITCLEREENMRKLGTKLLEDTQISQITSWENFDIIKDNINKSADMVTASYMLNELTENVQTIALEKLWSATNKILFIIEPGTPENHKNIMKYKQYLVEHEAHIIAPCPHQNECPLIKENLNDWCNFEVRVERTKIHKNIKNASSPFEDEKFIYLIASKEPITTSYSRLLRHPKIEKGYVEIKVCKNDGIYEDKITKKASDEYKIIRKSMAGDEI